MKIFTAVFLASCMFLSLCGCGAKEDAETSAGGGCGAKEDAETSAGGASVEWQLGAVQGMVDLHTEEQRQYLADDYTAIGEYAKGTKELSRPKFLTLSWSAAAGEGTNISRYELSYATKEDFSDAIVYSTAQTSYDITNLYVASQYYWRVTAVCDDGKKSVSPTEIFFTDESAPRNLYVDGVTNVRDLGGWKTADGGRVKQGMIYRCGRLNKSETKDPVIEITEEGINTMLYELGVRSEIDLRMKEAHDFESGGIVSSPLGESVNYYNVELEWNNGNYLTDNLDSVKEFFSLAADESNYPFIFHCNIGTDRTGMFAFFINGLLGVSEEDLYRDYLFSNFGKIDNFRTLANIENNYLKTVKETEGATIAEKIQNCLESHGVSHADIEAVKKIMK